MTTAPRRDPTLLSTVLSLQQAGWNPFVYAEPNSPLTVDVPVIEHKTRKGVWHNWVFAVQKSIQSSREFALICQDDVAVHPESMAALETLFDGVVNQGPISVYTPRAYGYANGNIQRDRLPPGIHKVHPQNNLWGAVGIAWRVDDLRKVIEHPLILTWRGVKPAAAQQDICNSDVAIGKILQSLALPIWYPVPSMGVHTASFSSIPGHGSNDVTRNRNAESPAKFTDPLWRQLFPGEVQGA